jgi:hypothetical protein
MDAEEAKKIADEVDLLSKIINEILIKISERAKCGYYTLECDFGKDYDTRYAIKAYFEELGYYIDERNMSDYIDWR